MAHQPLGTPSCAALFFLILCPSPRGGHDRHMSSVRFLFSAVTNPVHPAFFPTLSPAPPPQLVRSPYSYRYLLIRQYTSSMFLDLNSP